MSPYVKLLLKLRLASWNPIRYFHENRTKRKSLFTALAMAAAFIMLGGYLIVTEIQIFRVFAQLGQAQTPLALVIVLSTLLMIFTSFFYVLSELFFSRDVQFISALPIPSRQILFAKMARIWLGEAGIALAICLPMLILYGLHAESGIVFYLAGAALILTVPMIPIAVVTLLSFVLIRISALWKHREAFTVILSVLFLLGYFYLQMQWTSSAGSSGMEAMVSQLVRSQNQYLHTITSMYPPAGWFSGALTAGGIMGVVQWLAFALFNIAGSLLVAWGMGKHYQQLAMQQSETLVRAGAVQKRAAGKQIARTPLRALYRREVREIFMSPSYVMNCLATSIIFPVLIIFAAVSGQGDFQEIGALLSAFGTLPIAVVIALITAIFALEGSMNMAVATSVSREGKRHAFFRTLPVTPQLILYSKLLMGITIGIIGTLPSAIVFGVLFPALWMQIATGFVLSLVFILFTALVGLMMDVQHPKFGWKTETQAIKQNYIAALSMFGGMGVIALLGLAFYGLMQIGISAAIAYCIICLVGLASDGMLLYRLSGKEAERYIQQEVIL